MPVDAKKICSKCCDVFICGGNDCWCRNHQITDKNLSIIRASWEDCLCPACLQQFSENNGADNKICPRDKKTDDN